MSENGIDVVVQCAEIEQIKAKYGVKFFDDENGLDNFFDELLEFKLRGER